MPRPCGEKAKGNCAKCDREVCADHAVVRDAGLLCIHCDKGELPPDPVLEVPADVGFRKEDLEVFERDRTAPPQNAWADLT